MRDIHLGYDPQDHDGALTPPAFMTSTYAFETAEAGGEIFRGDRAGYVYGRIKNPTQALLEERIASLEGGEAAIAFSSGMGAITTTIRSSSTRPFTAHLRPLRPRHQPFQRRGRRRRPDRRGRLRRENPRRQDGLLRNTGQPEHADHRHRLRSPTPTVRWSWSATRSARRSCNARSSTAPTWLCIRRRSSWAGTAICSVASWLARWTP